MTTTAKDQIMNNLRTFLTGDEWTPEQLAEVEGVQYYAIDGDQVYILTTDGDLLLCDSCDGEVLDSEACARRYTPTAPDHVLDRLGLSHIADGWIPVGLI